MLSFPLAAASNYAKNYRYVAQILIYNACESQLIFDALIYNKAMQSKNQARTPKVTDFEHIKWPIGP